MDPQVCIDWLRARERKVRDEHARLQEELRELSSAIRCIEREAAKRRPLASQGAGLFDAADEAAADPESELPPVLAIAEEAAGRGVPLSARKESLVRCLKEKGPLTRRGILAATGMPPGSLSALLTRGAEEGWLLRQADGTWRAAA